MANHGLIIRRLRTMNGDTLRSAAQKIGRSTGWLSEIENGSGRARLTDKEFDRIVALFDGDKHRSRFKNWVITDRTVAEGDRSLDGAILRYFRRQKNLSLVQASKTIGIARGYLTNLENGHKPVSLALRSRVMTAYGYAPSTFRNMSRDKRGHLVPALSKIRILLKLLNQTQLESVLNFINTTFKGGAQ